MKFRTLLAGYLGARNSAANGPTLRRLVIATAFSLALAVPTQARAVFISFDYSFDTPVFTDPLFGSLNTQLAGAGPTVTGTISFNTNDVSVVNNAGSGVDLYFAPAFTHTGEVDTLGFATLPTLLVTLTGTTTMTQLRTWLNAPGAIEQIGFGLGFDALNADANCQKLMPGGCGNTQLAGVVEKQPFTSFTLVETILEDPNQIAEPTTVALIGLGLVGLGFARGRRLATTR